MQAFFAQSNPWALKDMTARLLEAVQRGLWQQPSEETRKALEANFLAAEAALEARAE
jgi:cobaltochelatase CobN